MTAPGTSRVRFESLYPEVAAFRDAGEEYERIIRRVYESILVRGDTAVDVGAHVGKHSLPLALACGPVGRVISVEPIKWAIDRLEARRLSAGLTEVIETFHGCCADTHGDVKFLVVPSHPGWSSLAPRGIVTDAVETTVAQTTIDRLCGGANRVRFVKVDVEGAEPLVLRGATRTLPRWHPVIHVEVVPSALAPFDFTVSDVAKPLRLHGYHIFDLLGNDVTHPTTWESSSEAEGLSDYIAIHPNDHAYARIVYLLRNSFTEERLDRSRAPMDLPLPPKIRRPGRNMRRPPLDGRDLLPEPFLRPNGLVPPTSWPQLHLHGEAELLLLRDGCRIYQLAEGSFGSLSTPRAVALPISSETHELADGSWVQLSLDLREPRTGTSLTLVEVSWTATGIVTVCQRQRNGSLEVFWLDGGRRLSGSNQPIAPMSHQYEIKISHSDQRVHVSVRTDSAAVSSSLALAKLRSAEFRLTVGARRHYPLPGGLLGAEVLLSGRSGQFRLPPRFTHSRRALRRRLQRALHLRKALRTLRRRLQAPS